MTKVEICNATLYLGDCREILGDLPTQAIQVGLPQPGDNRESGKAGAPELKPADYNSGNRSESAPASNTSKVYLKNGMRVLGVECEKCGHETTVGDTAIREAQIGKVTEVSEMPGVGKAVNPFSERTQTVEQAGKAGDNQYGHVVVDASDSGGGNSSESDILLKDCFEFLGRAVFSEGHHCDQAIALWKRIKIWQESYTCDHPTQQFGCYPCLVKARRETAPALGKKDG